jgi:predicted small lipoprotein YifL
MAARDRYTSRVICPGCGQEGVLHISEDDYPFMSHVNRAVDKVEGKFHAEAPDGVHVVVSCAACGAKQPLYQGKTTI